MEANILAHIKRSCVDMFPVFLLSYGAAEQTEEAESLSFWTDFTLTIGVLLCTPQEN